MRTVRTETKYYVYNYVTGTILEVFDTIEEAQLYSARSPEPTRVNNIGLTHYGGE